MSHGVFRIIKVSYLTCKVFFLFIIIILEDRESGGESPEVYDRENTIPTVVTRRTLPKYPQYDNKNNGNGDDIFGTNIGNRRVVGTIISYRQTRRCVNRVCETVTCNDNVCETIYDS